MICIEVYRPDELSQHKETLTTKTRIQKRDSHSFKSKMLQKRDNLKQGLLSQKEGKSKMS